MNDQTVGELPVATRDLERARTDLDEFGYCLLAGALDAALLGRLRARLDGQARAERETGIGYLDGAAHQNWGSFHDASGRIRADAFGEAAGGVNQRVFMLVNKGGVFLDLLGHRTVRAVVDHVLGEHYLLSSFTANVANPGGVAMKLHTDQWWAPAPTRRGRAPLPVGSMRRDRFDADPDGGDPPPTVAPPACCNVMWMLDDFTEANGATRIVPGSHLSGRQPDPERDADVITVAAEGAAGTAMVFEGRLWHGTGANTGNAPRRGLLTTFCGPQYRPQANFTIGTRAEVLAGASDDLRELLGFRVWCGYGRTDTPLADFVDPSALPVGELSPD